VRSACPNLPPLPDDCGSSLGITERDRRRTILTIPNGTNEREVECALDLIALDYRPGLMSGLIIESPPEQSDAVEKVRSYLVSHKIPANVIRVGIEGNRLRVRLAR
jgi:hypothetical protein